MSEWISVYRDVPKDGQLVKCRIAGEEGYCGAATYEAKTSTFRSYEDQRNRLIITVWKSDEWAERETPDILE